MAAGDKVPYHARYATHPTNDIVGVQYASIGLQTVSSEQQAEADAIGGPADVQQGQHRLTFELYGTDLTALLTLLADAAANLVIGATDDTGNVKWTLKNAIVTSFLGNVTIRPPDQGGPISLIGVAGVCEWAVADTIALMLVRAADA